MRPDTKEEHDWMMNHFYPNRFICPFSHIDPLIKKDDPLPDLKDRTFEEFTKELLDKMGKEMGIPE